MNKFDTLLLDSREAVEILSLHRPDRMNAVNPVMVDEASTYFRGLHERLSVRVVILRGSGNTFCAGADLGSEAFHPPGAGRPQHQLLIQKQYSGLIKLMRSCPQPIIGLLHGPVCGAGLSLALACDIRLASPTARLNAAYLRIGLGGCDMGSGYLLPRLVGLSVAAEMLMTGRFVEAERAKAIGLVSDVVPEEDLLDRALELTADMLRASPMGLRMTKETLNMQVDAPSLEAALMLEDRQQVMLLETEDFKEGDAEFREKRSPHYGDH